MQLMPLFTVLVNVHTLDVIILYCGGSVIIIVVFSPSSPWPPPSPLSMESDPERVLLWKIESGIQYYLK